MASETMIYLTGPLRTLSELNRIPVPASPPWKLSSRSTWTPVNHGTLARTILEESRSLGLRPGEHRWQTNESETDLFGCVDFGRKTGIDLPRGLNLSIGVRHSNEGRYAVTLVFGAQVLVCENGLITGEKRLSHKHTSGLDIAGMVREGLAAYIDSAKEVGRLVRRLKGIKLTETTADHVLVEAGRRQVLAWSHLGKVEGQWREPEHAVFKARTAWSLYNAFTAVIRERSPPQQFRALRSISELFEPKSLRGLTR